MFIHMKMDCYSQCDGKKSGFLVNSYKPRYGIPKIDSALLTRFGIVSVAARNFKFDKSISEPNLIL